MGFSTRPRAADSTDRNRHLDRARCLLRPDERPGTRVPELPTTERVIGVLREQGYRITEEYRSPGDISAVVALRGQPGETLPLVVAAPLSSTFLRDERRERTVLHAFEGESAFEGRGATDLAARAAAIGAALEAPGPFGIILTARGENGAAGALELADLHPEVPPTRHLLVAAPTGGEVVSSHPGLFTVTADVRTPSDPWAAANALLAELKRSFPSATLSDISGADAGSWSTQFRISDGPPGCNTEAHLGMAIRGALNSILPRGHSFKLPSLSYLPGLPPRPGGRLASQLGPPLDSEGVSDGLFSAAPALRRLWSQQALEVPETLVGGPGQRTHTTERVTRNELIHWSEQLVALATRLV